MTQMIRNPRQAVREEGTRPGPVYRPDADILERAEEYLVLIDLPVPIDADKVEAVHRHGVLTLRLPKAPEHRPRQIQVKAE